MNDMIGNIEPRFIVFLKSVGDALVAQAGEDAQSTGWKIEKILERNETSNGLTCLRFTHIDDECEYRLFAAGTYKDKSMIKVERLVENEVTSTIVLNSSPKLIWAWMYHCQQD